jgi:DNA-binding NarL/FixJ family response regulator
LFVSVTFGKGINVVILGSNLSINKALGEMIFDAFGNTPVQIDPGLQLKDGAIQKIRSSKIIIADLASLNRDSRYFIRQIRELNPDARIVALHIYNEKEFIQPIIDAGASAYLLVNAEKEDMIGVIENLIKAKNGS